jgi:hypothetical protein
VIPERAFDEARGWIKKAEQVDAVALGDLEGSMGGYGLSGWARTMLAEQILALIRLTTAKTFSGSGGE